MKVRTRHFVREQTTHISLKSRQGMKRNEVTSHPSEVMDERAARQWGLALQTIAKGRERGAGARMQDAKRECTRNLRSSIFYSTGVADPS